MPSNSNDVHVHNKDFETVSKCVYQPIHLQNHDEKMQVESLIKFIKGASNYALYCLQQSLPGNPQLCTFDPLVWLPPELLDTIFSQLSIKDLLACATVNKTWNWYMSSHHVWRSACSPTTVDPICARQCRTDTDWMVASRDSLAVCKALRTEGALVIRRVMIKDLTAHSAANERYWTTPPSCVVAKDGVLCAAYEASGFWLMHDTTFGRTWAVNRGSSVSCFRFVDASKNSKKALQRVGMVFYGTTDGTVHAPIEHLMSTRLDYRRHAGAVISCDADFELEIMASIGRDRKLRVFSLWSMAMLFSEFIPPASDYVYILKPHNGHFNLMLVEEDGVCTKYSWPITPGDHEKCKVKIETLNPHLTHFYENIYDNFTKYGDFLNIEVDKLIIDRLECEEVVQVIVQADIGTIGGVVREFNEKSYSIVVYDALTFLLIVRRSVPVKIQRLVGVGRRFGLALTAGSQYENNRLVVFDLSKEDCIVNVVEVPHVPNHPMHIAHSCPSGLALDCLPVTEMRQARLEASDRRISSRYKRHRCITEGRHPLYVYDNIRSLICPSVGDELEVGSNLLHVDPEDMEELSQLEDSASTLSDSDLENCSGDRILFTTYDMNQQEIIYVTWNLLAGRKEPRRDKLKGE